MESVIVHNQAELDNVPKDYKGQIYIESNCTVVVGDCYYFRPIARGNSSVEAWENSSVEAWGNSSVEARGNSSVEAWENSSVEAWENSSVVAWENSSVEARGNSSVEAWGNSSVEARGNSSVVAWENSSVVAWENSSVEARENSSVEARANVQVAQASHFYGKIKTSGNARIVKMPKCINAFFDFYGIKHTKTKAVMYKAVHKNNGKYVADFDHTFEYEIGKYVQIKNINTDINEECGRGIHVAHLSWALDFGSKWSDVAILECETKIDDIIMPNDTNGKVRTSKIKVLREVPLEECGIYGKIIKRRLNND